MRLLKLTLQGFKSFADKTEITFDKPIVGIVGPNGCGKSNVVDAIKWVLGEQSAKSLRGGSMQDVIFNGSSARPPMGMAQVTLTFENPVEPALLEEAANDASGKRVPRKLPIDADLVEVTRQLFRDGTSDYLINGQRARLRDVKETFLDTGVGTDAYSVIEQGKVSRMLEANPKERRLIFEEAAGISRFKARKKEAQRKLDKTGQNLALCRTRLEETAARLRSVKMQAARARAWQDYQARLKDHQLRFGLAEFHVLTRELDEVRGDFSEAEQVRIETAANLAMVEAELTEVEARRSEEAGVLAGLEDERRTWLSRMEQARQRASFAERQIAEIGAAIARDSEHAAEVEEHLGRHAREAGALRAAAEALAVALGAAEAALVEAREANQIAQEEADTARAALEEATRAAARCLREAQGHRAEERSLIRFIENMAATRAKLEARVADADANLARASAERDGVEAQLNAAVEALVREEAQLLEQKSLTETLSGRSAELAAKLAEARDRRSGIASRHNVLSEMEQKHEGVAETVKAVLAGGGQAGQFHFVRAMLADLIEADAGHAALVEAALGEHQQALVAQRFEELLAAKPALDALAGRVSFLAVEGGPAATLPALPPGLPTVAALVRCPAWVQPLVDRILGRTVIVRDLDAAHMARVVSPRGLRFVTRNGQVLDADGRVQAGPIAAGIGLISRRSELAVLTTDLAAVEAQIAGDQALLADLSQQAAAAEQLRGETQKRLFEAKTAQARQGSALEGLQVQVLRLEKEAPAAAAELGAVVAQISEAETKLQQHALDAEQMEAEANQAQESVGGLQEQIAVMVERAEMAREQVTQARVESSTLAEQRDGAERALRQHGVTEADLHRQRDRLQDQLAAYAAKQDELARTNAESLAESEEADVQLQQASERCEVARAQAAESEEATNTLRDRAKGARSSASAAESAVHKLEMRASNLTVKSDSVKERVQEQLGLSLEEKYRFVVELIHRRDNPIISSPFGDDAFEVADENELPVMGEASTEGAPVAADSAPAAGEGQTQSQPGGVAAIDGVATHAGALSAATGDGTAEGQAVEEPSRDPLAELVADGEDPFTLDMAAVKEEMEELQTKITRLGGVNLDAIEEEVLLEGKQDELGEQVRDIEEAKLALETLIEQINVDSRGRFEKTFNEIEANFAGNDGMFRRIFGGGQAKLKLVPPEDEVDKDTGEIIPAVDENGNFDVLEAGIEIVAQPPGKRPVSLSQLSGGEKTMTALALLMAIFGTRPSPYAILDEVDAALDEANVDRYVKILKSFLHTSHFIVITHRKPTMQGCDALYGITQEERGVSKRVRVNVDQVSAEGSDDVRLAEGVGRDEDEAQPVSYEIEKFEEPRPKKRSRVIEAAFDAPAEDLELVTPEEKTTTGGSDILSLEKPVSLSVFAEPEPVVEEAVHIEEESPAPELEIVAVAASPKQGGFPDLSIKPVSENRKRLAALLLGKKAGE